MTFAPAIIVALNEYAPGLPTRCFPPAIQKLLNLPVADQNNYFKIMNCFTTWIGEELEHNNREFYIKLCDHLIDLYGSQFISAWELLKQWGLFNQENYHVIYPSYFPLEAAEALCLLDVAGILNRQAQELMQYVNKIVCIDGMAPEFMKSEEAVVQRILYLANSLDDIDVASNSLRLEEQRRNTNKNYFIRYAEMLITLHQAKLLTDTNIEKLKLVYGYSYEFCINSGYSLVHLQTNKIDLFESIDLFNNINVLTQQTFEMLCNAQAAFLFTAREQCLWQVMQVWLKKAGLYNRANKQAIVACFQHDHYDTYADFIKSLYILSSELLLTQDSLAILIQTQQIQRPNRIDIFRKTACLLSDLNASHLLEQNINAIASHQFSYQVIQILLYISKIGYVINQADLTAILQEDVFSFMSDLSTTMCLNQEIIAIIFKNIHQGNKLGHKVAEIFKQFKQNPEFSINATSIEAEYCSGLFASAVLAEEASKTIVNPDQSLPLLVIHHFIVKDAEMRSLRNEKEKVVYFD